MTVVVNPGNVRPKLISQSLAEDLGRRILSGAYPSGTRMTQDEICMAYKVSRVVCREAVVSLVSKGLIISKPNMGTVVTHPEHWSLFDPDLLEWAPPDGWVVACARQLYRVLAGVEELDVLRAQGAPMVGHLMRTLETVTAEGAAR